MSILSTRPLLSYCSVFKRPNYTKNFKEAKGVMKGKSGAASLQLIVRELYRLAHGPLIVPAILAFKVGAPALSRCAPPRIRSGD